SGWSPRAACAPASRTSTIASPTTGSISRRSRKGSPAMSRLEALRTAALPFVTRSLRGGRLRRTLALSLLLSILTVVLGAWISFGDGDFEAGVRVSFGLEESRWSRQQNDYVIVVDSPGEAAELEREL